MIEAHQLTRRYGDFTAVDRISFAVDEGEIVGILGPNGAGKTTTIRMLTGFLPPTDGRVAVGGKDLFGDSVAPRRDIGYLPENVALYPEMRVSEYLVYRGQLEGMSRRQAKESAATAIEQCFLTEVAQQIIGTLSKGYRQRVGLAGAILHEPKVLVLDEPTVGLDPKQIIAIRELIRELGRRQTLILSTHILPEVELLCDRVMIIDRGSIVAEGTPQSLRESWVGNTVLEVEVKGAPAEAAEVFAALDGVLAARRAQPASRLHLECERGHDPREAVFRCAVERDWVLLELVEKRASLEDIFVRLTTRDAAAGDGAAANGGDGASREPAALPAGEEETS